jgi:hypothetical protein
MFFRDPRAFKVVLSYLTTGRVDPSDLANIGLKYTTASDRGGPKAKDWWNDGTSFATVSHETAKEMVADRGALTVVADIFWAE